MPAKIKFANGEVLLVGEDPDAVLDAIRLAVQFGQLKMAQVNGDHPVWVNVDQIRSVSAP